MRVLFLLTGLLVFLPVPAWAANVTVAVLEFANTGADPDWAPLGKGFQEMFLVDLAKAESIDVIERRTLLEKSRSMGIAVPADLAARTRLATATGATHLLAGSFRVEGDNMVLEVELLDARAGKLLLDEDTVSEKDAFFELQKGALKASISALNLALTPKERADTSRLHTADFLAFQDFSRGLDLFDSERYEASLGALRQAAERDVQFSLAQITLEAYEELITQIRTKADALHVVQNEEKRLAELAAAGEEVEVLRRLLAIAAEPGDDNRRERLTALHTLSVAYGNLGTNRGKLRSLRAVEDHFAMARAADQLAARYYAEALPLWPALPLQVSQDFYGGFPEVETFDKDWARCIKTLWERGADYPQNRINYLNDNLRYPREMARMLHLDLAAQVRLHDLFLKLGIQNGAPDYWIKSEREELVQAYRTVLRFDDSTRIVEAFAKQSENEYALRGFAEDIEVNHEYERYLRSAADKTLAREWVQIAMADGWSKGPVLNQGAKEFSGKTLSDAGKEMLTNARDWPSNDKDYLLVGDTPVWVHQYYYILWSGPRTDARRTSSIRYAKKPGSEEGLDTLAFVGGVPLSDLDMGFDVSWTVPSDFRPRGKSTALEPGDRPTVSFMIGLTYLNVPLIKDPTTDERLLARPMRGTTVRISPTEIAIVSTVESKRGSYERKEVFDEKVLSRKALKRPLPRDVRVDVAVRGGKVVVKVGDVVVEARADEVAGYQALRWGGAGFVEVSNFSLRGTEAGRPVGAE
jgi:TolB-like protein